jgi:hypothetical protein
VKNLASMLILGLLPVLATPAAAHIACDGDFQVVEGREIATPYCADKALAKVARERGDQVTGGQVRNNPATKDEVCRFIGGDPRVSGDCIDVGDDD